MSLTITCVHQGFELYGSDRSFVESVKSLRAHFHDAIIIAVLPQTGPIVSVLEPYATRIEFEPLWILRRRDLPRLMTVGLLQLPGALLRAFKRFRGSDLVYINTSVIVDYTLAARFWHGRALLHVHELPDGLVRQALRLLLRCGGSDVIFNSKATQASFLPLSGRIATHVLYNGIAGPGRPEPRTYAGQRPLRVLMLGRISRIKGQDVLLDALAALTPDLRRRMEVRIVGSAFGSDEPVARLEARIHELGLADIVRLLPFDPDPSDHYRWADVVAVPSRLPESLGRVAIEALAFGRPPLVSDIGGLPEIVQDGVTGWLVPPGDVAALAECLRSVALDPARWATFPDAGRRRFDSLFAAQAVADAFVALVSQKLGTAVQRPRPDLGRDLAAGTPV